MIFRFGFKTLRICFGMLGLWLCDSYDKIRSKNLNMAGMWPRITKKLLKWEKAKKILFFFIWSSLCPLFCEKVIVLTAPALSCRSCGKFYIGFSIFSRCWTTLPIWRVSNIVDLQHVHINHINHIKPRANTKLGI